MADPAAGSGRRLRRTIVPVLIILGGLAILLAFKATRRPPEKGEARVVGALVETIEVQPGRRHVMIETHGTVTPRYEVALVPQVQGKVAWVHSDLVTGAVFGEGDTLVRIEDADYALAVQRARAQVAQAQLAIEIERAQGDVAHREWILMNRSRERLIGVRSEDLDPERLMGVRSEDFDPFQSDSHSIQAGKPVDPAEVERPIGPATRQSAEASARPGKPAAPLPSRPNERSFGEPDPLVLREPQLKQAEANLVSARAALATAELNLERTVLRAPFDCRIRRQNVAPGQFIGPGTTVAHLYNTDLAEIEVGISLANLEWVEIPGAEATVILETGQDEHHWEGHVHRSVGVLDELGRLARVIVRVKDPFSTDRSSRTDLNMGSFVTVVLRGREVRNVIPIPRQALHENDTVWIMNDSDELDIRSVSVTHMNGQEALVAEGLRPGERVVISPLAGPVPGMQLRAVGGGIQR